MSSEGLFNPAAAPVWSQLFDGDPAALAKLRSGTSVCEAEIAALADQMCNFFTRRSPFAFVSHPEIREQRFLALRRGELFFGVICIAPNHLPEMRRALIQSLRHKGAHCFRLWRWAAHVVRDEGHVWRSTRRGDWDGPRPASGAETPPASPLVRC